MIGNDVIDLELAKLESDWRRTGYLEKIFTATERDFLSQRHLSDLWIWNLWSRKEAAYKIVNRRLGIRAFIPLQLECVVFSATAGTVWHKDLCFATKTARDGDCLHTIATSRADLFAAIGEIDANDLTQKNGLPWFDGQPATKSHHGRFEKIVGIVSAGPNAI